MKVRGINSKYFLWSIPACIILSILLTSILSYYNKIKITKEFQALVFVIESEADFDASLYYTYSDEFNSKLQLFDSNKSKDTLTFLFPKHNVTVKKFRLDFGNDSNLKKVKINSLGLRFQNDSIGLNSKEVFDNLFQNSGSIALNKDKQEFIIKSNESPFDPYVVFMPLGEISKSITQYLFALLSPFVFMILGYFYVQRTALRMGVKDFLILFFIVCIPLKIAWTTFATLLLLAYFVYRTIQKKKLEFHLSSFIFLTFIFVLLLVFGRPTGVQDFSKELAFLIFAFISTIVITSADRTIWQYSLIFLVFNAIIVAYGISFLLWFEDFYGLGIPEYFNEIKTYSGQIRNWLFYDHAAFLSFFGLTGLLFFHGLYEVKKIEIGLLLLYHVILIMFIVLVGSRICLLIYMIYLLNFMLKIDYKKRILANIIALLGFVALIFQYIDKIDYNRYRLWEISWNAIKQRPWFGYGLNQSDAVLQNQNLIDTATMINLDLNHSHNQYLTGILEIGFVGVFTIAIFIAIFFITTRTYRNKVLLLFITGLGYMFITESILQTSKPLYVICFLFLLIISDTLSNSNKNPIS